MPTVYNLKHRFEPEDAESHHHQAGEVESTDESRSLSPRARYPVPYVNERREFDPQYDPRNILLSPQQEVRSGAGSPPLETETFARAPNNSTPVMNNHMFTSENGSNTLGYRQRPTGNRAAQYFGQRIHTTTTTTASLSFPNLGESVVVAEVGRKSRSVFHSARRNRPYDEVSSGSEAGVDSLEEFLQEESSSATATRTTLTAIQEQPSLERNQNALGCMPSTGSLSYSITQHNSMTSNENPTLGVLSSPDETLESNSESIKTAIRSDDRLGIDNISSAPQPKSQQPAPAAFSFVDRSRNRVRTPDAHAPQFGPLNNNHSDNLQASETRKTPSPADQSSTLPKSSVDSHFSVDENASSWSQDPLMYPAMATKATPKVSPSPVVNAECEKLLRTFNSTMTQPVVKKGAEGRPTLTDQTQVNTAASADTNKSATGSSTGEESQSDNAHEQADLSLHDLCGESASTDDIAWRNAIYLLSTHPELATAVDQSSGWLPLHITCMSPSPPPLFMTRALLYTNQQAAQKPDDGGRLPLHLIAASSCDPETMQLLVEAYPQAVYHIDSQGWTPLHLMLKNFQVDITLEHCRVLIGLTTPPDDTSASTNQNLLQRRGDHLNLGPFELQRLVDRSNPITRLAIEGRHEEAFKTFPGDVRVCLRRLYYWKRRQRRLAVADTSRVTLDLDISESFEEETNPAAFFTPTTRQLPIHIIVRRGLSEGQHSDEKSDAEESTKNDPAPRFLELVRLFIAVYPTGLIARDGHGYTPLLTALIMANGPPSQELVELLLGKRTSGYESLPPWASNMSLYNFSAERYINPAMVATKNMHQLPLHIVAEEMGNKYSILATIHESYPGAIQVQDYRGRTPLHLLLHSYRQVAPDPRMVAVLLSDQVAQTLDDDRKLPFDLLVESAHNLPLDEPLIDDDIARNSTIDSTVFRKFFQGTIVAAKRPNVSSHRESDCFLWRLRSLPPWLRRQACSATFVQELLVEELARPAKCALVLLYGLLLGLLIALFRYEMVTFVIDPELSTSPWNVLAIYGFTAGLFFYQVAFWALCGSMSDFLHLCFFNFWRWVDMSAIVLVTATTYMINHDPTMHEQILNVGTAATGMLWLSTVGFLSSWWYGFAMFTTAIYKITTLIFWPVVVAAITIVGFAEMFYMLAQVNCADALGDTALCSLRDAYQVVYFLASGEPVVDIGGSRMATGMMVLTIFFIALSALIMLTVLAMVVLAGSKCDFDTLATNCFWAPKLTFILFASSSGPTSPSRLSTAGEDVWDITLKLLQGKDWTKEKKYWYACCLRQACPIAILLRLIALVLVPMWLLAGLLTFGLAWPPQVRRYLFRPCLGRSRGRTNAPSSKELYASQLQSMRNDVSHIRDMSYERSNDIQRDIRELKDILRLATME